MIQLAKRIAKGAVIAAGGAFVWALVGFTGHNWQPGGWLFEVPALAAYAVLVTSWFVLPMGGILGAVMPAVVRGRSQTTAFLRGALLGVCSGVLAALITTVFMEWPSLSDRATIVDREAWQRVVRKEFISYLTTMTPICAVWVGVWACRWSKRVWPNTLQPTAASLGISILIGIITSSASATLPVGGCG